MSMTKQTMSAMDWIQMIADAKLQGQGWQWARHRTDVLRNAKGECPLCALASTIVSHGFKGSFVHALRAAFGDDVDTTATGEVACVADRRNHDDFKRLQQALFAALGLDEHGDLV